MSVQIQTPSGSGTDLVITPSLDVGLYTNTTVKSSTGTLTGTDTAETGVLVTVTVDGYAVPSEVAPAASIVSGGITDPKGNLISGVMYEQRFQQLSTKNLTCTSGQTCDISLVLSTMSAHAFNFVAQNMMQGTHTVNVYATIANPVQGNSNACVGPGTLTVVQAKDF